VVRTTTIAKWKISKVRSAIEVLRKKRYKDRFKSAAVCKTAQRKVFAIAHTHTHTHTHIYIQLDCFQQYYNKEPRLCIPNF
jgi:hypothetical protein